MNNKREINLLLNISLFFYSLFIVAQILLLIYQTPLKQMIYNAHYKFLFPFMMITLNLIFFIIYIALFINIKYVIINSQKRIGEVLSIIYFCLFCPLFPFILKSIENARIITENAMRDNFEITSKIISIPNFLLTISGYFIILACAMSWYNKKYISTEHK